MKYLTDVKFSAFLLILGESRGYAMNLCSFTETLETVKEVWCYFCLYTNIAK